MMKTDNPYEPPNTPAPNGSVANPPPLRWLAIAAPYISLLSYLLGGEVLTMGLLQKRITPTVVAFVVVLILMVAPMGFVILRSGFSGVKANPFRCGAVLLLLALFLIFFGMEVFRLLIE